MRAFGGRLSETTLMAFAVLVLLSLAGTDALAQTAKPPVVPHDLEGREQCLMCHTPGAMEPVPDAPASHAGRGNETCTWCHAPDAAMQTTDPPSVPHDLAGMDNCLMCHTPGAMEPVPDVPADHAGRESSQCRWCHAEP